MKNTQKVEEKETDDKKSETETTCLTICQKLEIERLRETESKRESQKRVREDLKSEIKIRRLKNKESIEDKEERVENRKTNTSINVLF